MSDFSSDSEMEVDEVDIQFTQATEHVQRTHGVYLPSDLLELYALYKQATSGRCNTQKPGILHMQARSKWSAWNDLGDMKAEMAKKKYIEKVQQLDPTWHEQMKQGLKVKSAFSWIVHSVHAPAEEEVPKADHEKTCFDHVKERNLIRLQTELREEHLQVLDEHGMGLIHWATDRNSTEILEHLIKSGVDINMIDAEQQTALHYAASCGHVESMQVLLFHNADRALKDADGQTCLDVAENIEVRTVLEKY